MRKPFVFNFDDSYEEYSNHLPLYNEYNHIETISLLEIRCKYKINRGTSETIKRNYRLNFLLVNYLSI